MRSFFRVKRKHLARVPRIQIIVCILLGIVILLLLANLFFPETDMLNHMHHADISIFSQFTKCCVVACFGSGVRLLWNNIKFTALVSNSFYEGDFMMFRKDSLLFYQSEILYIVMAVLCLTVVPMVGGKISFLYLFPFIVLILVNPQLHNEFIAINETGISCQKSGKQLWAYEWDGIAELKRSSRFLMPSIEVIAYNKHGESEQFALPNQYFQLGKTAREAIKRYYKPTERPLKDGSVC